MAPASEPSRIGALLRSSHLGPVVVTTLVPLILGIALGYPLPRLLLLTAAVLAGQFSIGWSNDWLDASRDTRAHRTDKPAANGAISPALLRTSALCALAVTIVFSLLLGPLAAAAHLVGVAGGWAYNLWFKNNPLSVVPFIVSFGLLPAVATFGQENPQSPAWWVYVVGALLGVAAHFTNVLPDLEADRDTGVRGLPQRLGARVSGTIAFLCLAGAAVLLGFAPGGQPTAVIWIGFALSMLLAVTGVVLVATARPSRWLLRLIMAGAIVDVAMLALSGSSLTI